MNEDFDSTESTEELFAAAEDLSARDSVYGEIKRALVARGIPAAEIAFIHDFPTAAKKAQAFADMNAGRIRVMIGSTEKCGTGINVQERLIALHHVTPVFKASCLEQREGRIIRQGNIFPEVHICVYVTESSFDAYMWSLVETKARFISQIMAGEVTARTAEDIDQLVLTAAQIKAIASGNPQILEKVALEVELTRLEKLYSAWSASRQRLRRQLDTLPTLLDSVSREIAGHQKAIKIRDKHTPQKNRENFTIELLKSLPGEEFVSLTDRQRAGVHLRQLYFGVTRESKRAGKIIRVVGRYRGFEIIAQASGRQIDSLSSLFSEAELFVRIGESEQTYGFNLSESDIGVTQSMDAQLRGIDAKLTKAIASQREIEHRRELINAELQKVWEPAETYQKMRIRVDSLNKSLTKYEEDTQSSANDSVMSEDLLPVVKSGVSVHQILTL